jgi:3-dehydroquinate dehydratase-2
LRVTVLHGPNLNLLGQREPEVYGRATLQQIDDQLRALGSELNVEVQSWQSNVEGELVDRIQAAGPASHGFLINAGGYTHTSVAILDALVASGRPFVEVHLSNVHAREAFRRDSLLSPRAAGVVFGFGVDSYLLGLRGLVGKLRAAV